MVRSFFFLICDSLEDGRVGVDRDEKPGRGRESDESNRVSRRWHSDRRRIARTYDHLDVKVDGKREDLGTEVTSSELLDEIRVLHRQTLGELHGSEGEDKVGDL